MLACVDYYVLLSYIPGPGLKFSLDNASFAEVVLFIQNSVQYITRSGCLYLVPELFPFGSIPCRSILNTQPDFQISHLELIKMNGLVGMTLWPLLKKITVGETLQC